MFCDCAVNFRQFYLLLWKNFILQIRRPIGTGFELILPLLAVVLVIILKHGVFDITDKCFVTFEPDPITLPHVSTILFYAPNNTDENGVMAGVQRRFPQASLMPATTESEMIRSLQEWRQEIRDSFNISLGTVRIDSCINGYGIVFGNLNNTQLQYTIRPAHEVDGEDGIKTWNTRDAQPRFQRPGPRVYPNVYLSEGFLHLQNLVGMSIIEQQVNKLRRNSYNFEEIPVNTKQIPYPPYEENSFLLSINAIMPLLLVLSFIYSAGILVKELVSEKETRMRESLKMMGLSNWILWLTWYLKQFLFLLVTAILMAILIKVQIFEHSDYFLILIFLILFINCLIAWGFLISAFFSKAVIGMLVGFLAWFLNFFPYLFLSNRYDELSTGEKILSCFLSNTCMGLGVNVLSTLEIREEGVTWANAGESVSTDDDFNLGIVFAMLILDSIIYMLIAWYIDAVFPGEYGIPKPFYFFVLPSYWLGTPGKKVDPSNEVEMGDMNPNSDKNAHEQEPSELECGISIRGIGKVFKVQQGVKVAVDNLFMNMYRDQITVLLGHNGAGKTTTMSMLVGLFPPTSGDAIINGYSIVTDMNGVRQSLGLCPQYNVLYDRLTVREHLNFFARLKGMKGPEVKTEVESMLKDLQLVDKAKQKSSALSGGQKRKLSVGIALVANSQFVILDEPTSGMDPYARRATWDLLTKHKQGRTILLTTHFMDEADLLGDRIAIMAEGQMRCSGSSLFLKSRYGVGYHMVVTKEENCDSQAVIDCVTSTIPGGEMSTDVGAELSFILPSSGSSQFPALFEKLEAHKTEYGISGFGVSVTTMEEVFIKVGEGFDHTLKGKKEETKGKSITEMTTSMTENEKVDLPGAVPADYIEMTDAITEHNTPATDDTTVGDDTEPNTGFVLWIQQFYGLLVKRFLHSIRNWRAIITQVVLPVIFILLGLILIETVPGSEEPDPQRTLNLPVSALTDDNIITFFAEVGNGAPIIQDAAAVQNAIRATQLVNMTDDVLGNIDDVRESNNSNVQDCCDYRYQILDTFCASQISDELMMSCRNGNFGYSKCTECLSCNKHGEGQRHLATCTLSETRENQPDEDDTLCPYPPNVAIDDTANTSKPLDYTSYFVDEHLIYLSDNQIDTTDFFRQYMAGFVISKQENSLSVCRTENMVDSMVPMSADANDALCMMIGATPIVESDLAFTDTLNRQQYANISDCTRANSQLTEIIHGIPILTYEDAVDCAFQNLLLSENYPGSNRYPECNNIDFDPQTFSLTVENATTNVSTMVDSSFRVSGTVRQIADSFIDGSSTHFGRVYAPISNTEITGATIYYNNQPYHMPAAALNAFHTIYLRHVLELSGVQGASLYSMSVNNHPLPRTAEGQVDAAENNFLGFSLSITVIFGLSFLAASFILYPVAEKASKAKHIQFVSGVHVTSFWLSAYLWDLINAFVLVIAAVILFAAFPNDSYRENIGAVFLLFFLFCWSGIPIVYCMSFLFSNALIAFALTILLFFFSALFCLIIVFVLEDGTQEAVNYIFLAVPSYSFSQGLGILHTNYVIREACRDFPQVCADQGTEYVDDPLDFNYPGIGLNLIVMAAEGFLCFGLTLLLEQEFFIHKITGLFKNRVAEPVETVGSEDSDVAAEKNRINSGESSDDIIQLMNIKKKYKGHLEGFTWFPPKYAVRGLSLGIPRGECFGLLGVNGAGKTTTFNMLTGDIRPSNGTALITGFDITTDIRKVQQRIGYCPQFDALIDDMTAYELLWLYARLRGIPEKKIKDAVETEIKRLDLLNHADRLCGTYSGGNKRKLSTAIALVGSPIIVFLDEPTTGMDPATRRHLWDALITVIKAGKSIVLTSHSMEECEALCTRLAIMVNGEFKCLGGIQHLKTKFGKGFTLHVKIGSPEDFLGAVSEHVLARGRSSLKRQGSKQSPSVSSPMESFAPSSPLAVSANQNFHNFIKENFDSSILLEEHQGAISYQLEGQNLTWSYLFRKLEENKTRLLIVDYSVSQTTLEQVFLNFARNQLFEEQ